LYELLAGVLGVIHPELPPHQRGEESLVGFVEARNRDGSPVVDYDLFRHR